MPFHFIRLALTQEGLALTQEGLALPAVLAPSNVEGSRQAQSKARLEKSTGLTSPPVRFSLTCPVIIWYRIVGMTVHGACQANPGGQAFAQVVWNTHIHAARLQVPQFVQIQNGVLSVHSTRT